MLGRPLAEPEAGLRPLILRYLAAFGPASVQDMTLERSCGYFALYVSVAHFAPKTILVVKSIFMLGIQRFQAQSERRF